MPELGIPSEKRRDLEKQADYDKRFASYERTTLPKQTQTLIRIAGWIKEEGQRAARTCFERLPRPCHRHCVSDALQKAFGPKLAARHL